MITRHINTGKKKFEWIDILNPTADELNAIAEEYELHNNAVQDSLQPEHLPKFEWIDDTIFIIVRVFDPKSKNDADSIQEISNKVALFVGKDFIITIHRFEQPFLDEIRTKFFASGSCAEPNDLLLKILYQSFQSFVHTATVLETELDNVESLIVLKDQKHSVLRNLYHLKRRAAVCMRIIRLSKPIIDNLDKRTPAPVLQDLREFLLSLETSFDQLIDNAHNLLNLYVSLSSQRTNEVMRVLTLFSVFFLPLTFIVGVYGMNFEFMPEIHHPLGYPFVILAMVAVTLGIYIWFKKKRWL